MLIRRCVNTNGSFVCELIPPCSRGFRRTFNGTCLDINECSENLHNCRLNLHQYCVNKEGGFECLTRLPSCPSGYEYSLGARRCEDIDECLTGQYSCDARFSERCVNLPGTYRCAKLFSITKSVKCSTWNYVLGQYNEIGIKKYSMIYILQMRETSSSSSTSKASLSFRLSVSP